MARILIAGLGSIGSRHLRNLVKIGEHDVVLLRRGGQPHADAPWAPVFTDLTSALRTEPDAVLVCTPTANHMDVALAAASAGCDLFVEKPLSHNWDSVESLLSVARQKSIVGMVGFDLRFESGLAKVHQLVTSGIIGHVTSLQAQVGQYLPDWHPWEDYRLGASARAAMGGGVVLDLIHELDYATWIMGEAAEVVAMTGHVSTLDLETEDTASMSLRFRSGAIGTVHLDYVQRTISRTCRIVGEMGTVLWDAVDKTVRWYTVDVGKWHEYRYRDDDRDARFIAELKHFLTCAQDRSEPVVSLEDGSRVLRLALAAKESAATGSKVGLV
jgi:predicted dehydrogenase